MIRATIITIGDEILIGQIVDTNSAWLAKRLNSYGIRVHQMLSVADAESEIHTALDVALTSVDIILITGGLGPTKDDITKKALCSYFNTPLTMYPDVLEKLETFFRSRGRVMNEANKMQALLPLDADIIPNNRGTAQGMWFNYNGKSIISMPGVPHEMKEMVDQFILPALKKRYDTPLIIHKNIMTIGIGESMIADKIEDIEDALPTTIKLAYLPSLGMVRIRLSAYVKDQLEEDVHALLTSLSNQIASRIPQHVYSYEQADIEEVLGKMLLAEGATISTAESCTGGAISSRIASVPGCSAYFPGSIVTYSYEMKMSELKVRKETLEKYGAVSTQCVEEMLDGLLSITKSTYGITVSGIAGPTGATADKPVGTVYICVGTIHRKVSKRYQFTSNRNDNIALSIQTALYALFRFLHQYD